MPVNLIHGCVWAGRCDNTRDLYVKCSHCRLCRCPNRSLYTNLSARWVQPLCPSSVSCIQSLSGIWCTCCFLGATFSAISIPSTFYTSFIPRSFLLASFASSFDTPLAVLLSRRLCLILTPGHDSLITIHAHSSRSALPLSRQKLATHDGLRQNCRCIPALLLLRALRFDAPMACRALPLRVLLYAALAASSTRHSYHSTSSCRSPLPSS